MPWLTKTPLLAGFLPIRPRLSGSSHTTPVFLFCTTPPPNLSSLGSDYSIFWRGRIPEAGFRCVLRHYAASRFAIRAMVEREHFVAA